MNREEYKERTEKLKNYILTLYKVKYKYLLYGADRSDRKNYWLWFQDLIKDKCVELGLNKKLLTCTYIISDYSLRPYYSVGYTDIHISNGFSIVLDVYDDSYP